MCLPSFKVNLDQFINLLLLARTAFFDVHNNDLLAFSFAHFVHHISLVRCKGVTRELHFDDFLDVIPY